MLEFSCPKCSKKYKAPESSAGKGVKCACGNTFKIPVPIQEAATPPQEDVISVQPQEDAISIQPQENAISVQEEPDAAEKEAPPAPTGAPGEPGEDEEPPPTLSSKGVIFLILAVIMLPALGIYANHGYKGYLANAAFIHGVNALDDYDDEEAFKHFKECIDMRPRWSSAYLPAAFLAYKAKDLEKTEYLLKELVELDNASHLSLAYNNLAVIAMMQEKPKYDEVRSYFERAVEEDSGCAPANLGLSMLSYDKNNIREAENYLKNIKENTPGFSSEGSGTHKRMLMRVAFAKGDKKKFLAAYKTASGRRQDTTFQREAAMMALELLMTHPDFDKKRDMPLLQLARKANTPKHEDNHYVPVQMAIASLLGKAGMHSESAAEFEKIVKPEDAASDFTYMLTRACAAASRDMFDKEKKAKQEEKALVLYKKLVDNEQFLEKKGKPLILEAMDFCIRIKRREKAWEFLKKGMASFPNDAKFYRMAGALSFQDSKFKEGIDHFESSLELDPNQKKLQEEMKRYHAEPTFVDFRPSRPGDFVLRPLVHIKMLSGTPFPINPESIKFVLDGNPQKLMMGGSEGFFIPKSDLEGGEHVAEFFAEDALGNSAGKKFTFRIDLSGPVAKMIRPGVTTEEAHPIVEITLEDELSAVDMESVSMVLKSVPGNPHNVTVPVVFQGKYNLIDKSHGIENGNPVGEDGKIVFRVPRRLRPGKYVITVKMSDTLGNDSKQEIIFTMDGEAEDTE